MVVFSSVLTLIGLRELYAMLLPQARPVECWLATFLGTTLVPLVFFGPLYFQAGLLFAFFLLALLFLFRFADLTTVVTHLALVLFGLFYVSLLLGHLPLLHALPQGREWIYLVLLIVMGSDTAAYFVGVSCGKRRLYPSISPKKSLEGSLGGLAGSLAGAALAKIWFFAALGWIDVVLLAFLLGILGPLGDLFESMLKRGCNVKDSGNLIPGHGGLLDRLDSLLFTFPLAYYYALWRWPL